MAEDNNQKRYDLTEVGSSGLKRWGGIISEEFIPELMGRQAIRVYKEMKDNDAVIGAFLFAIEMLIRQASWRIDAASPAAEDQAAAEFLESCMNDMSVTWSDTIAEILSFLPYGWSYHEIVYKRRGGASKDPTQRSKYNDGLIGWRKIPLRGQDTLHRWLFNEEDGGVIAMEQLPPPDYKTRVVPIEKALLFRTTAHKGNPEGRSVLRNAYRPWYFKRRMEEIEGIGVERDLAGLPVLVPPEDIDLWDDKNPDMIRLLRQAEDIVQNIRRDRKEGLVMPFGWELKLLNTGARRSFSTTEIINRYDNRIAMTVLADFILMGHEKVGSFALGSSKTSLFGDAIGAWLNGICDVLNRYAVPRLFELNPTFRVKELPKFAHGDIEAPDLAELSTFIKDMTGVGAITPDNKLEEFLRQSAHLPDKEEDDETAPGLPGGPKKAPKTGPAKQQAQPDDELDPEDPEAQQAAKRRLGRVEGE